MTDERPAIGEQASPQPLLDLQRLVVAVRRQRRFWVSFGLLCMLAGMALAVFVPPPPTAVTRLLIIHEQDQPTDGGTLMRTDVALMETARMAEAALASLGLDEDPEEFLATYDAVGVTNNVLELKVVGADDADAVARAKALADAFIADHVARLRVAADANSKALIGQRDRAQTELNEVDAAIVVALDANLEEEAPAELESLYARRAELVSRVSELSRRAEEAAIGAPGVAAGTQIVDAPRALRTSTPKAAATSGAVGLVLGLTIGLAVAAVATVVRDRPILRREIAANLGASVIAQLSAPGRGPGELWRRRRRNAERRRIASMLVRASRDDITGMSLLELGCVPTTVALALDMADALAIEGPVVLIDDLPRGQLQRRGAKVLSKIDKRTGPRRSPIRIVDSGDHAAVIRRLRPGGSRERQLGVGSARPGTAWTDLGKLGSETVLIVRTGHASTTWLHTVARQLADLQIPVLGVVLVNPDPRDRTDGTLWAGLHSAVRGRPRGFTGRPPAALAPRAASNSPATIGPAAIGPAPPPARPSQPVTGDGMPGPEPTPEVPSQPGPANGEHSGRRPAPSWRPAKDVEV